MSTKHQPATPLIPYESRPTDMLQRQLLANRKAARERDAKGRKKFAHILPYRPHFVREIVAMKRELRERGAVMPRIRPRSAETTPPAK